MMCSDYYLTHYDLHNNLIQKKVERLSNDNNKRDIILKYPYKNEPIYDIFIRNAWEILENKLNFPASFFGYTKFKKYNLVFEKGSSNRSILSEMKNIREARVNDEKSKNIEGIMSATDLTPDEYLQKIKQRDDYLTDEEIYAINKYNIKKCYQVNNEDITESFLEEYNDKNKMKWYRNLSTIKKSCSQNTDIKLKILKDNQISSKWITNCYLEFTSRNIYTYHYYALEILNHFKLDINDFSLTINEIEYDWYITDCITWLDNFRKEIAMKYDLRIPSKSLLEYSKKEQVKFINSILFSMYGIKITKKISSVIPEKQLYSLSDHEVWNKLPRDENDKIITIDLISNTDKYATDVNLNELDVFIL
jgi:hypothetical protein